MYIVLQESEELLQQRGERAWFDGDELAFATPAAISNVDSQVLEYLKV